MQLFDRLFDFLKQSIVDYYASVAPMTGETEFPRD
jgi:hypothetical protein